MPKTQHNRPIEDDIKQDIASAAEEIPKLIYQSFRDAESPRPTPSPQREQPSTPKRRYRTPEDQAKKRLILCGVSCIMAVIIAMWGWNMRMFWYQAQTVSKEQPSLWEDTKKDLDKAIVKDQPSTLREALDKQKQDEEKRKQTAALSQAVNSLFVTAATSTTSTAMSTSTVPATTTSSTFPVVTSTP